MSDFERSQEAFGNKQTVLVRGNDARCMSFWDEEKSGSEQDADGPTYIVIGRHATDGTLQQLAQRYGHTVEQLQAFRDAPGHCRA